MTFSVVVLVSGTRNLVPRGHHELNGTTMRPLLKKGSHFHPGTTATMEQLIQFVQFVQSLRALPLPPFDPLFIAYGALALLALLPIYCGSFHALVEVKKEEAEKMSQADAYLFPVIGSGVLFGFYLLFKFFSKEYINHLLTAYFGIFGATSLGSMLGAALHAILPARLAMLHAHVLALTKTSDKTEQWRLEITWPRIVALLIASAFTVYYVLTKNWVASNLFGVAFALSAITMLHLDSFKTGMTLLAGLFVYDVFWVFGTDVMVSVAKSFNVPVKLLFPRNILAEPSFTAIWNQSKDFTMLGLGDIVIPGVFVALCLRFDEHLAPKTPSRSFPKPYFYSCFVAYIIGLATTMTVMHVFKAAQPALLYLSPACCLAPLLVALVRGQLSQLFSYSTDPAVVTDNKTIKQE